MNKKAKAKHIEAIDKFIPEADALAKERVKQLGKKDEYAQGESGKPYRYCFFCKFFHEEMNRLTINAGLRRPMNGQ